MEEFSLSIDQASIATITWDLNGKSMNVMTQKGSEEFYALIDKVIDDQNIRGVIITSGKKWSVVICLMMSLCSFSCSS